MKLRAKSANRANATLTQYCNITYDEGADGNENECAIRDLLADLLHYCTAKDVDFDNELRVARDHWQCETSDDYLEDDEDE